MANSCRYWFLELAPVPRIVTQKPHPKAWRLAQRRLSHASRLGSAFCRTRGLTRSTRKQPPSLAAGAS